MDNHKGNNEKIGLKRVSGTDLVPIETVVHVQNRLNTDTWLGLRGRTTGCPPGLVFSGIFNGTIRL